MHDTARSAPHGTPLIFGEVLFDEFEDGSHVLGGAPFNVAWHLQGFGLSPLFVSRIGADRSGDEVLAAMKSWGMRVDGVQRDGTYPTGAVKVALARDGQPSFSILPDQAYDFIDADTAQALVADEPVAVLYHGSLIVRQASSAQTLQRLQQRQPAHFVDVNLRAPWWEREQVVANIRGARWVKLNDEELHALWTNTGTLEEKARQFRQQQGIDWLIVTRGADGALLLNEQGTYDDRPPHLAEVTDTVGAGDAFSAVTLLGLLKGWAPQTILSRAMEFAATICGVRGATPADPTLYRRCLDAWGKT